MQPLLPEILAFAEHNHHVVLHPVLRWESRELERAKLNVDRLGFLP